MNSSPLDEIQQLKRQLQNNWNNLENNNNDNNEQELEEGTHLEKLSRQLTAQLQYNNELLTQLQHLEEQQLAHQKDAQEKKIALRQALGVCENIRGDMLDLKRKLQLSEETQNKAVEESNQYKSQLNIKQTEIASLLKFIEESKEEILKLKQEKDSSKRDADRAMREQKMLREELTLKQEDDKIKAAERRADMDLTSKEISTLKSKVFPLEAELRAERTRVEELNEILRMKSLELINLNENLSETKNLAMNYKERCDFISQKENEYQKDLENKIRQLQIAEAQIQAAKELVHVTENELRDGKRSASDAISMKKDLENEIQDLKLQLETIGNDLYSQTQSRRLDRERYESKIVQLQNELESTIQESRLNERKFVEENSKREQEFIEYRQKTEESKSKLQNENARLNELLQGMQREHKAMQNDFQLERDSYEERISEAIRRQRQAEATLNSRDSNVNEEVNKLKEKLVETQQQLSQRTRIHVDSLGALENTIHKLANECHRLQAAHDALLDEMATMKNTFREYLEAGNVPLEEWHEETKRAMASLVENLELALEDKENARKMQIQAENLRDEDKTKNFILTEEMKRIEDDFKELQDRYHLLENNSMEKIKNVKMESEGLIASRNDLESLVRRLQDQIERANEQNRSMQEDLEKSNNNLNEAQNKSREKISLLEEKINSYNSELVIANAEKDSAQAEYHLMKKKVDVGSAEINTLMNDIKRLQNEKHVVGLKDNKDSTDYQKKLALLSENMRKQSTQLTQTKSLLQVVQEQRKHLQEENLALRNELDELLSKSLRVDNDEIKKVADDTSNLNYTAISNASTFYSPSKNASTKQSGKEEGIVGAEEEIDQDI